MHQVNLEAIRNFLKRVKQICVRLTPHATTIRSKGKEMAVFVIAWAVSYQDAGAALHDIMQLPIEPIAMSTLQNGQATIGGWLSPIGSYFVEAVVPCVVRYFGDNFLSAPAFVVACYHSIKHTWASGTFVSKLLKMIWVLIQKWIDRS